MKTFFTSLFCLSLCITNLLVQAQTFTIPAGNTASGVSRFPLGSWYGYEYTHSYYTARELGSVGGTVHTLSWYMVSSLNPGAAPVEIRLLATPDSLATLTNTIYSDAGSTLVYSGTLNPAWFSGANKWINFNLTTPFVLPAGSNLLVIVKTVQGGSGSEGMLAKQFAFHTTTQFRAIRWATDNTVPVTGTLTNDRPNIRVSYTIPTAKDAAVENIISPQAICGTSLPISINVANNGTTPTGIFSVFYRFNNGTPVSVSSANIAANSSATINFPVQNISGNGPFVFKFWTSLAGDLVAGNDTLVRTLSRNTTFAPLTFQGFTGSNISSVFPDWSEGQGNSVPTGTASNWTSSLETNFGSVGATLFMFGTSVREWLVGPAFVASTNSAIRLRISKSDFSGNSTGAMLGDDSLKVMLSTNCGVSWQRVGAITAANNLTHVYQIINIPLMTGAGQEIKVALQATSGSVSNTSSYYLNIDDVSLVALANADIGTLAILNPAISCGLSASTTISAQFFNYGLQAQTNVPVFYSINNQAPVAGVLPSIGANASADFTFGTPANFSLSTTNTLKIWSALTTDLILANDTVSRTFTKLPTLASVNFTAFTGSNLPNATDNQWQEHTGNLLTPTPTNSSSWVNSFTDMATALGSSGATINLFGNTKKESLVSTAFVVPATSGFRFKAAISTFSGLAAGGMGSDDSLVVLVSTNCGTSWQRISSLTTANNLTNQYTTITLPLAQFADQEIRIALKATDGVIDNPQDYYLTVDDLAIVTVPPVDLTIEALTSPAGNACGMSATTPVTLRIRNIGTGNATGTTVSYRINNGPVVTENITAAIASNATLNYTFAATANLSNVGTYNFSVWTSNPTDPVLSNDTLKNQMVNHVPIISTFPYFESFETNSGSWIAAGQNSSWALGTPAKPSLTTAAHGTRAWINGGLSGSYGNNELSHVISPCFNFSALIRPWVELRVWWKAEASWDGMSLQYTTNNGQSWLLAGNINTGENWYNDSTIAALTTLEPSEKGWTGSSASSTPPQSDGWRIARHLLPQLAGAAQVRFRVIFGSDGSSVSEGVGFDAIRIYESPQKDLTLAGIINPSTCGISDTMRVRVNVRNEGTAKQGNFSLSYRVGSQPIQTVNVADSIAPGQTRAFAFPLHPTALPAGNYTLTAWVTLPADINTSNDTLKNYAFSAVATSLANTTFTGFDGSNIATALPGWSEGSGISTPTSNFSAWNRSDGDQTAFYGATTAKVNLYTTGTNAWLISKSFKVEPNNLLEYDLGITDYNDTIAPPDGFLGSDDKLIVMITTNCGVSWSPIHTITKDSVLTTRMRRRSVSLNAYANQIVQIAFLGTDGNVNDDSDVDVHINNIRTRRLDANDISVLSLLSPLGICGLAAPQTLSVRISNVGFSPQTNIPIRYSINNSNPVSFVFAGPLAPNAQATITFPTPINLSMAGAYRIKVWSNLSTDANLVNDTAATTISRFVASTPVVDFNGFIGNNLSTSATGWREATGASLPVTANSAWTNASIATNTVAKIALSSTNTGAWLISPAIQVFSQPQLSFKAALRVINGATIGTFGSDDTVSVRVSTNCGTSWQSVLAFRAGSPGTPALSATLAEYTMSLSAFANKEIVVAFKASDGTVSTPGADFILDDVSIRNNATIDIGVSALTPLSFVRSTSTNIRVRVTNYGTTASPNTAVYTRFGNTDYTTPLPAIAAGASIEVMPGTFTGFVIGTFAAEAYTLLSTDQDRRNDTLKTGFVVVEPSSVAKSKASAGFEIYPNPGKGAFTLLMNEAYKNATVELIIRDLSGKTVYQTKLYLPADKPQASIELDNLAAGTYIVSVVGNQTLRRAKLIVSK